jgi:putative ABC transport system permease protein
LAKVTLSVALRMSKGQSKGDFGCLATRKPVRNHCLRGENRMNLIRLALRSIAGSPFRSAMVFLCVALVAGSAMWATLVVQGAEENLRLSMTSMERPGADIVAVPGEAPGEADTSGGMGMGAGMSMGLGMGTVDVRLITLPGDIAAVPGVAAASPQLHLTTLYDTPYCAGQEMFLVAFDPATDFTVQTWLERPLEGGPGLDEAIAGSRVSAAPGEQSLTLSGYKLKLVGHLAPTGTSLDRSLFVTFETARHMARLSRFQVAYGLDDALDIAADDTSVILVKVAPGEDPREAATRILENVPGVVTFDNTSFFQKGRNQMASLLRTIPGLLGITWVLSVVFIGLVFSVAVNERRREIGVLRALGSTRSFVLRSILAEGSILALGGGAAGVVLTALAVLLFRDEIVQSVGLPLSSPSPVALLVLALGSLAVALASVTLAALFPALRISRQEPAVAMRG